MQRKLSDMDFYCLMFEVISYKDLWYEAVEKELVTLNESEDDVVSCKTFELQKYLQDNGVKFYSEVDKKLDCISCEYFAEFED